MPDASDARFPRPVQVAVLPQAAGTAAEVLARDWLAGALGVAASRVGFDRSSHGRPLLRLDGRASAFDCNWSHSGGRLALALGEGLCVGIDIESPRPRPRAAELARRYFTADEADALMRLSASEREAAFLRLWCAKEAVLKAHGRGLAFGLDRLRFDRLQDTPRLVAADPALRAVDAWTVKALDAEGLVGMVAWRATGSAAPVRSSP